MAHLIYVESVRGYSDAENNRRENMLRLLVRPGFTIELRVTPDGPKILEQPSEFEQMRRAALNAVRSISPDECGAIISAGAVDPALRELREAAAVPVIGPGEASLYLASFLGSRLVILTVEPAVAAAHAMIEAVRTKPTTVIVRTMKTTVRKILADTVEGKKLMREATAAAIREDNADMLYLGSMTQGALGISQELRDLFHVPVIDPLPVAIQAAEQAALARGA
jgi:allantoin racemase